MCTRERLSGFLFQNYPDPIVHISRRCPLSIPHEQAIVVLPLLRTSSPQRAARGDGPVCANLRNLRRKNGAPLFTAAGADPAPLAARGLAAHLVAASGQRATGLFPPFARSRQPEKCCQRRYSAF